MADKVMHHDARASLPAVRSDSEKSLTVQTDSEDHSWFTHPARVLLGSDPGLSLHVLTGISESSGYRYANGSRAVPGYIVRQLFRSSHGWQWLCALMEGCDQEWWVYAQRAVRKQRAADAVE